jgi:hypothetical protein
MTKLSNCCQDVKARPLNTGRIPYSSYEVHHRMEVGIAKLSNCCQDVKARPLNTGLIPYSSYEVCDFSQDDEYALF